MASIHTNEGRRRELELSYRNEYNNATPPTVFKMALITDVTGPTDDDNLCSSFTEFSGSGYTTAGYGINRDDSASGFDTLVKDDGSDLAYIQTCDVTWTAGEAWSGIYWGLLTNGVAFASAEIMGSYDLSGPVSVGNGQTLTLQNAEIELSKAA